MKSLARSLTGSIRSVAVLALATLSFSATTPAGADGETIRISGSGAALATMQALGQEFKKSKPEVKITILPNLGSGGSIKAVLAGTLDIGISARPLKPEERAKGGVAMLYARTPLVFATAQNNQASGLTAHQLADIYAGRTTAWPDGSPIRLVLRPSEDSDTTAMMKMSAEMQAAVTAAASRKGLNIAMTDQEAADLLEKLPGALGSTTLALIISEKRGLKPLPINGMAPAANSGINKKYPYYKEYSLVTTANPSPLAAQFIAFIRSVAGRAILINNGQLPIE
ncbi:MAG: substrate-binding domain-containing protein [Pseudomonadota bacterium]